MEKKHVFTKSDIDIVDVTPLQAQAWLNDCNKKNRKPNIGHIARISEQMKRGQWMFNGDTICFDWNGVLIDGQHRLTAIADCGKIITCIVVRNLNPECIMTKDMEMKARSLKDLLEMDNVKSAGDIASYIKKVSALRKGMCGLKGGNSHDGMGSNIYTRDYSVWDLYDFYYEHRMTLDAIVPYVHKYYKKRSSFFVRSEIGGIFAYLIIEKKHTFEKVSDFFNQLYFGHETCPSIETLRDKLNKDSDRGSTMLATYKQAIVTKAWNYYVTGKKNKSLHYDVQKEGRLSFI